MPGRRLGRCGADQGSDRWVDGQGGRVVQQDGHLVGPGRPQDLQEVPGRGALLQLHPAVVAVEGRGGEEGGGGHLDDQGQEGGGDAGQAEGGGGGRGGEHQHGHQGGQGRAQPHPVVSPSYVAGREPAQVAQETCLEHCVGAAVGGVHYQDEDDEQLLPEVSVEASQQEDGGHPNHLHHKRPKQSGAQAGVVSKEHGEEDEEGERDVARHGQLVGELLLGLSELYRAAVEGEAGVPELVVPEVCHGDEHGVGEEDGEAGVVEGEVDRLVAVHGFTLRLRGEGVVV